jgi:ssDNA-binding Zn-finger/Zn-ribbon topoisomerase 1
VASETCPVCFGPMRERRRRRDNHPFLGCQKFPKCRGTRETVSNQVLEGDGDDLDRYPAHWEITDGY